MLDVVAMFLTGRGQACAAFQRLERPIEQLSRVGKRLLWPGKSTGGACLRFDAKSLEKGPEAWRNNNAAVV